MHKLRGRTSKLLKSIVFFIRDLRLFGVAFSYWRVVLARESGPVWHPKRPITSDNLFSRPPRKVSQSLKSLLGLWKERTFVQSSSCTFLSEARDLSLCHKLYFLLQLFLEGQIVLENIKSVPDRSLESVKGFEINWNNNSDSV